MFNYAIFMHSHIQVGDTLEESIPAIARLGYKEID